MSPGAELGKVQLGIGTEKGSLPGDVGDVLLGYMESSSRLLSGLVAGLWDLPHL